MVILSRRFVWQSGLKISAHKFLPCFLSTACLFKNDTKQSLFIMHCRMAFTKQVFPKFLNPRSDILELIGQNYFHLYLFKSEYFTPPNAKFRAKTYIQYKLSINVSTIYRKLFSPRPQCFRKGHAN